MCNTSLDRVFKVSRVESKSLLYDIWSVVSLTQRVLCDDCVALISDLVIVIC